MLETMFAQWETVLIGGATAIGLTVARALVGYFEKCSKEKKMVTFDTHKLIETFMRMIPQIILAGATGIPVEATIGSDWLFSKYAKKVEDVKKK